MALTIDKKKCVGCRACELACSFYRTKEFCPENSNIRIYFTDEGNLDINILKNCQCSNKEKPLCVEFCPTKAIECLEWKLDEIRSIKQESRYKGLYVNDIKKCLRLDKIAL